MQTDTLQTAQTALSEACSALLDQVVRQLGGADAWTLGTAPPCFSLADDLEAKARATLADSLAVAEQNALAAVLLQVANDFRIVARCGTRLVQITWLLRETRGGPEAAQNVQVVAQGAARVAQETTRALAVHSASRARNAALLFADVDTARQDAERTLFRLSGGATMEPRAVRLARAGIWTAFVAGKFTARVAARQAQSAG